MNMNNFFEIVSKYAPTDDNLTNNNNKYLDLPPPKNMSSNSPNPQNASEFQTNSLLFIEGLFKKMQSKKNKNAIELKPDVKTNIEIFIDIMNTLINEMETHQPYNKTYVFVFFLFFLYFMNFRLGQIFLYYVFFHLRETSNNISDVFQNLIQKSMAYYSVFQLNKIVTDLSNNSDVGITVLPYTINGQIKHNEITFPNYDFMETFNPVLSNILKDDKSTTSTITADNDNTFNIVSKRDEAEKAVTDAENERVNAKKSYDDVTKGLNDLIKEQQKVVQEAKDAASQAKTAENTDQVESTEQIKNAYKNAAQAQMRCEKLANDLLEAFHNQQIAKTQLDNANKTAEIANNAYQTVSEMSPQTMTDSNNVVTNNNIENLTKYLPMTNKIDVKGVIQTMNKLSIGIAKKYNQTELEKETEFQKKLSTPKQPIVKAKGGKTKGDKTKSMKANKRRHLYKKHSMRKYT